MCVIVAKIFNVKSGSSILFSLRRANQWVCHTFLGVLIVLGVGIRGQPAVLFVTKQVMIFGNWSCLVALLLSALC